MSCRAFCFPANSEDLFIFLHRPTGWLAGLKTVDSAGFIIINIIEITAQAGGHATLQAAFCWARLGVASGDVSANYHLKQ